MHCAPFRGSRWARARGALAAADIPLIRGVDTSADVFVDGARDIGSQNRETFAVEQIEVFKGPSSAFGGRGAAAGGINIVSKIAREGDSTSFTGTIGTSEFQRITLDVNQELSDRFGRACGWIMARCRSRWSKPSCR